MSIAKRKCPAFSRYLFQCNAKSAPISTSAGGSPLAAAMPHSAAPPVRSAAAAIAARAALPRGRLPIVRLRPPRKRRLRPTTPGADAPLRCPPPRPPRPPTAPAAPRAPQPCPHSVTIADPPHTFRDRLTGLTRGSPVSAPRVAPAAPAPAAGGAPLARRDWPGPALWPGRRRGADARAT